jgi:hypothetical protein
MEDFVQAAAQRFGASGETTRSASSGLLGAVKENSDAATFSQLLDRVPGAAALVGSQNMIESEDLDLFSRVQGMSPGMIGRPGGSSAGLLGLLTGSGISTSNIGPFVSMFLRFIEQKAGPELTDRVSGSLPNLKKLVE